MAAIEEVKFEERFKDASPEQLSLYRTFATEDRAWRDEKTKQLLRKVDLRLLPLLFAMYTLNSLDRSNLAQARLGTLEKDLGMTGTNFNLATSIFAVGYLIFQLPSNLLITRARPSVFLGIVMTIWGIISAAQAATKTFGDLLATRICLGIVEAPFFPGSILLMSSWYTKTELTYRISWFFSATALANAIGGLLAAVVLDNLNGSHGIAGWRWLFIVEGSITIGIAFISIFVLPNFPHNSMWLTEEERSFARFRLAEDAEEDDTLGETSHLTGLRLALTDYRVWIFALLQHLSALAFVFSNFFPSIVRTLGYGRIESLLLTVPVWAATLIVSVFIGWMVGRVGDRSVYIICLTAVACVGNIMTTASTGTAPRYVGMFLMAIGAVSVYPIILAWIANSFARPAMKRSVAIAFCNAVANSGVIYGSYMFPISEAPRYIDGGSATAAICVIVGVVAFIIRLCLSRSNRKLEREELSEGDVGGIRGFRYPI